MNTRLSVILGFVLFIVALVGIVHGTRAGLAQLLNYRAKFGPAARDPDQVAALCGRAMRLYPYNYHICVLTAALLYDIAQADSSRAAHLMPLARYWCGRGLELTPYKLRLRWLQTRFLWQEAPERAIRSWEEFTAWNFWEPYNHAYMAQLYAQAGHVAKAEKEMVWAKGASIYEQTAAIVTAVRTSPTPPAP